MKRLVGNRDGVNGENLTYREIERRECPPGFDATKLYRRLIGELVCFSDECRKVILESQNFPNSEVPFRLRRGWYLDIDEAADGPPDTPMIIFKSAVDALSTFN